MPSPVAYSSSMSTTPSVGAPGASPTSPTRARQQATGLTGKVINVDRFRLKLLSVLGLGAYGVVYLAQDEPPPRSRIPSLSSLSATLSLSPNPAHSSRANPSPQPPRKQYAVKVLSKTGLDGRQRLFQRREIELHRLASGHVGVLKLHAVHETLDHIFVVLDYLPDGDLFGMITETKRYLASDPFPGLQPRVSRDELIKTVFVQILDALEHCHRLGIAHRDLKPENLLCRDQGRVVVLADFGLATRDRMSTEFGCGSSFYMSPECQGTFFRELGTYAAVQNDIWACGVILVNLTCGRNPWRQATMSDDTFAAFLHDPNFLSVILPISSACADILKRIFSINPMRRPTIPELRKMVKAVKRWNLTEKELKRAPPTAQEAARAVFGGVPAPAPTPAVVVAPPPAPRPTPARLAPEPPAPAIAGKFAVCPPRPSPPATARSAWSAALSSVEPPAAATKFVVCPPRPSPPAATTAPSAWSAAPSSVPDSLSFPETAQDYETESECSTRFANDEEWDFGSTTDDDDELMRITSPSIAVRAPVSRVRKGPPAPIFAPPAAGFVRPQISPRDSSFKVSSFTSIVSSDSDSDVDKHPLYSPTSPRTPTARFAPPQTFGFPTGAPRPRPVRRPTRHPRARTPTQAMESSSSSDSFSSSSVCSNGHDSSNPATPTDVRFARAGGVVVHKQLADGYESPATPPDTPVKPKAMMEGVLKKSRDVLAESLVRGLKSPSSPKVLRWNAVPV